MVSNSVRIRVRLKLKGKKNVLVSDELDTFYL